MSETQVLAAFIKAGCEVSIPYGDNARYDFVVNFGNGKLDRVQVKTGRYATVGKDAGCVVANLYSTHAQTGVKTKYTKDEIDFYVVYCPELNTIYRLPVTHFTTWNARLRVEAAKLRNPGTRWASEYEF